MTGPDGALRQKVTHVNAVIRRVQDARLRGRQDIQGAIGTVDEAIALFHGSEATRELLITAAKGYQLKGDLYLRLPMPDDALDAYGMAEDLFVRAGGDGEDFGRFLHDMSVFFYEHGVPGPALEYARRSRDVLAPFGSKYQRDLARWIDRLSSIEEGDGSARSAPEKGRGFPRIRGRARAEAAQARAVQMLDGPDARLHVDEIARSIQAAYRQVSKRGSIEDACRVLLTGLDLYWTGLDVPSWVLEATTTAMAKAEAAGRVDLVSDALTVLAACLDQRGQTAEALDTALRAIARHDEHMLATESSTFRMLTGRVGEAARALALNLAVTMKDGALAAELIEGARLQVEPGEADPDDTDPARRRSRVRGLRPVSVGGVSRLASYYIPGIAGLPLSLEATIRAIGGETASWWGTWSINQTIYWAVFLDGHWTCGSLSLAEGTELRSLLSRAVDASMHNPRASVRELITGEWCRNVAAEELLSADLGEALIPPELRQRLLETAGIKPISLVIAGNFPVLIPWPLLGLGGDFFSRPIRFLEAAVLRVAPPAILVERAVKSGTPARAVHPVLVACVDPSGNLPFSREIPLGTQTALSGNPASGYPPASLDQLAKALAGSAPGAAGLFYYSGHAVANNFSDDEDALALSGDSALSAHLLFGPRGENFPFPARSIISACQSSGASGGGAGEWLGLTAALLWCGSRQVVATNWKIWDTPFTSTFDLALADRLRTAEDVALALREIQIEALDKWRSSMHDYTDHESNSLPGSGSQLAFPLIWAAYCCVGIQI